MILSFPEPLFKNIKCLNNFTLKMIAICTMLTDHIGAVLFPHCIYLRVIGRIAFPIFVFLLVEGFQKTKNVRKYEIRMILFAFLSEIPFDLAFHDRVFDFSYQNVFFTLALGLILLDLLNKFKQNKVLMIVLIILFMMIAHYLNTDYSAGGILLIVLFYYFREMTLIKIIALAAIAIAFYVPLEAFSMLAFFPVLLYNGKKGPDGKKDTPSGRVKTPLSVLIQLIFYIFYPAHLLILHFIAIG